MPMATIVPNALCMRCRESPVEVVATGARPRRKYALRLAYRIGRDVTAQSGRTSRRPVVTVAPATSRASGVPVARGTRRQASASAASTWAACVAGRTDLNTRVIRPVASMRNVLRTRPANLRPYSVFMRQAP